MTHCSMAATSPVETSRSALATLDKCTQTTPDTERNLGRADQLIRDAMNRVPAIVDISRFTSEHFKKDSHTDSLSYRPQVPWVRRLIGRANPNP